MNEVTPFGVYLKNIVKGKTPKFLTTIVLLYAVSRKKGVNSEWLYRADTVEKLDNFDGRNPR